jgi:hypothetical protein
VDVVQFLIATDGVHVGIQTLAGLESIGTQGITLPFCQRVDDLHIAAHIFNVKLYGTLYTAEVVVKTAGQGYVEGGGNALQIQGNGQIPLEIIFNHLDALLRIPNAEAGVIALRKDQSVDCHCSSSPFTGKNKIGNLYFTTFLSVPQPLKEIKTKVQKTKNYAICCGKNIEFSDEKKSADPVKKACKNKGEMAKIP